MPTGGIDIGVGSLLASGLGDVAGGITADALVGGAGGALLGGAEGALTGGNIGQGILHGAEGGALTGGGIGLGGDIAGGLGAAAGSAGMTAGDALGGAAGGALGGVATGSSPVTGAIGGAASGGLAGALSGPSNAGTYGATGGPSGVSAPAPSTVAPSSGDVSLDASSLDPSNFSTLNGGGASSPASVAQSIGAVPGSTATTGNTVGTSSVPDLSGATASNPANATPNAANFGATTPDASQWGQGLNGATGNANNPDPYGLQAAGGQTPASLQSAAAAASGGAASTGNAATNPLTTALKDVWANPTAGNFGNLLTASPSADIAAAGVGLDALKEGQLVKGQRQIEQQAGAEAAQGASLEHYLQSGTLPPGLQAGVDQASQAAIASIKSQYAARGMSGSSAESQDIAAAQQRAQAQGAQMAMQLLQTGVQETGMSSQLYQAIMGNALQQDQNLGSAISGFAQAAAGGGQGGQTLKLVQGNA